MSTSSDKLPFLPFALPEIGDEEIADDEPAEDGAEAADAESETM